MTPGHLILVALAITIGGLVLCYLSGTVRQVVLQTVVYWTGIAVTVLGLLLLLFPVLAWCYRQVTAMFGV